MKPSTKTYATFNYQVRDYVMWNI